MAHPNGTRRSHGEGSLWYNAGRDRWEATLDVTRPNDKRRIRRTVTAKKKADASRRLRELIRDHNAGLDVRRSPTVAKVAGDWLTLHAPRHKAPSTLTRVRRRVDQHLIPALGDFRLAELQAADVEAWLAAEVGAGAALRTVQDYRGDLRQILNWAIGRRLVAWNPAAVAELPLDARPPTEKRSLTEDQAVVLLAALEDDRLGPYFTTLLLLGLRPGEADALRWDAIDGDQVVIDRALQRDDFGRPLVVGPTKTKQTRVLRLPPTVVEALRRQKITQAAERLAAGPGWSRMWEGHVFLNEIGRPLNPSNVRRSFATVCARVGLPRFTPYELRHSAASLLVAAGHTPHHVADQLGHADTRMLDRFYRHRVQPVIDTAMTLEALGQQAKKNS